MIPAHSFSHEHLDKQYSSEDRDWRGAGRNVRPYHCMYVFTVLIDRLADIWRFRSRRAPTWASNAWMVSTSPRSEPFASVGFPEG